MARMLAASACYNGSASKSNLRILSDAGSEDLVLDHYLLKMVVECDHWSAGNFLSGQESRCRLRVHPGSKGVLSQLALIGHLSAKLVCERSNLSRR